MCGCVIHFSSHLQELQPTFNSKWGGGAGDTCFRGGDQDSELMLFGVFLSFYSQLFVLFQDALKRK